MNIQLEVPPPKVIVEEQQESNRDLAIVLLEKRPGEAL